MASQSFLSKRQHVNHGMDEMALRKYLVGERDIGRRLRLASAGCWDRGGGGSFMGFGVLPYCWFTFLVIFRWASLSRRSDHWKPFHGEHDFDSSYVHQLFLLSLHLHKWQFVIQSGIRKMADINLYERLTQSTKITKGVQRKLSNLLKVKAMAKWVSTVQTSVHTP